MKVGVCYLQVVCTRGCGGQGKRFLGFRILWRIGIGGVFAGFGMSGSCCAFVDLREFTRVVYATGFYGAGGGAA